MTPMTVAEELRQAALHHFLTEHASSLEKFEDAEKRFGQVVDEYRQREDGDTVIADYLASSDPRLRQAQGDAAYYRDRAMLYAASAQLELMRGGLSC